MQTKKQYFFMDIMKFFFCFCVVALHTKLLSAVDPALSYWIEKGVLRLAVPFFFLSSGFLLGRKINQTEDPVEIKDVFKGYSKRLIRMLIVFEPISLILVLVTRLYEGESLTHLAVYAVRSVIFYPEGALWYIQASLVGVWILYFFIKKHREKLIVPMGIVLYLFAMLCNSYFFLIEGSALQKWIDLFLKVTVSTRNGVFCGFFFLWLGVLVHRLHGKLAQVDLKKKRLFSGILCLLSYGLFFFELYLLKEKELRDDGSLFLSLPVFIFLFLFFVVQFERATAKTIVLRKLSTGVYLAHAPIRTILQFAFLLIAGTEINGVLCFVCTAVLAVGISLLSYRSKNKFISTLLC